MKRLSVQSLYSTRFGNQIYSLDTIVKFLVEFNEIIGSLDFFGSFFINGKKNKLKNIQKRTIEEISSIKTIQ